MPLELLDHCTFNGPALPEPFVRFELEKELTRLNLLAKTTGAEGKQLQASWETYRRKLRELAVRGGPLRVRHCVLDPLVERLGYSKSEAAPEVETREGREDGGFLLTAADGAKLRTWATEFEEDLDAPARRGTAFRFSHLRIAQRVLLASGERIGLLTNGVQFRLLISDPARPDSEVVIPLESGWKRSRDLPDSFRFLLALCQPAGIAAVPDIVEKARLQQARVTKDLRLQAREAVERFVQEVLDHPGNAVELQNHADKTKLARDLWHEGLVLVYRLLFILKLESTDDPARSFSFTSSSLWRNTFSPGVALATRVRDVLDHGLETGNYLEEALRNLFRMFADGMECSELHIKPLGGALFGVEAAPLLDKRLQWGERAVAFLLDRLLWTQRKRSEATRQRVHYGALDVEDLGRVYEALLELDAGISTERLCRLRRQKLEVVVPAAQGEKYRPTVAPELEEPAGDDADDVDAGESEDESPGSAKKTKIEWIEEIPDRRFFLRVGLGRKATGSYYTPHSFVRFLVQETLGPLCAARSPQDDPNPSEILKLKVLDPAMGSGHFLVEACRFLAEKLYEACRLCDERADPAERRAENAIDESARGEATAEATKWRSRVLALPDPNDEILQYLPSRSPEGTESGISQRRALALCRRLVAVHCLYGVDKNRLAVELAKLSLWIESHGEGLPLTFLDHRLVEGDSLTGPFFEHLLKYPNTGETLAGLFADGLREKLTDALADALRHVTDLESTVGTTLSETEFKKAAKKKLDCALEPLRTIAAAWIGRAMSPLESSAEYADIVRLALNGEHTNDSLADSMALPYAFAFPEVFYPKGDPENMGGFDVVLGNPPWDRIEVDPQAYFADFDLRVLDVSLEERGRLIEAALLEPATRKGWQSFTKRIEAEGRATESLYSYQQVDVEGRRTLGRPDLYRLFCERGLQLAAADGLVGWVLPSSFHSNEGATGVRRLYLSEAELQCCYSFENKRKLFEIDSRFKFALVIARSRQMTTSFRAGFYLHDPEWLFLEDRSDREILLTRDTIDLTGGPYLSFCEVRDSAGLSLAIATSRSRASTWAEYLGSAHLSTAFGVELHRNPSFNKALETSHSTRKLFALCANEHWQRLPIHSGKTIHQYTDEWEFRCERYVNTADALQTRHWGRSVPHYRFAFRMKAASTNERTMIAALLTPGFVCEQTLAVETDPGSRPNVEALVCLAISNSYSFDFLVRQKVTTSLSNFSLAPIPLCDLSHLRRFLAHGALRLSCNHVGYAPLWQEQMGGVWREAGARCEWPTINGDDARWNLRSAMDAALAHQYSLERYQFEHILATFTHRSYPAAPALCLAKFDELLSIGREAYLRKYDPYFETPLNESLPIAVIELPGATGLNEKETNFSLSSPTVAVKRGRRK